VLVSAEIRGGGRLPEDLERADAAALTEFDRELQERDPDNDSQENEHEQPLSLARREWWVCPWSHVQNWK